MAMAAQVQAMHAAGRRMLAQRGANGIGL